VPGVKIGIVISPTCDVPPNFIGSGRLEMLPVSVYAGTNVFLDRREEEETLRLYRLYLQRHETAVVTQPLKPAQMVDLFLEQWVTRYDRIFVLCPDSRRSKIYANATEASYTVLRDYKQPRAAAGMTEPFLLRIFDAHTLFTGEAVLAFQALRLRDVAQEGFDAIRRSLETVRDKTRTFLIPDDLYYVYNRARTRGEESVNWLTYKAGDLLDIKPVLEMVGGETQTVEKIRGFEKALDWSFAHLEEKIRENRLAVPAIALSYGGPLDRIRSDPRYQKLVALGQQQKVPVFLSVMSLSAGSFVGRGAFSFSYAEN
jgi:fatty acid-binding protein DegV